MTSLPNFQSGRVLVIGDIMLDRYWSGSSHRISPEAPVPVVNVQDIEDRLGGAANVAHNIRTLGCHTALWGRIGCDPTGEIVTGLLNAAAIEHNLVRDKHCSTITKLRVLSQHQQLIRLDFEDTPTNHPTPGLLAALQNVISDYDVVVISDYAKGMIGDPSDIIALCNTHQIKVLVDPKRKDFSHYSNATLLTPNKQELEAVVGQSANINDLLSKAENLRHSLNLNALMVTLGENGMALVEKGKQATHIRTQAREVYDVTGAGDTVIACLAAALAMSMPIKQAMHLANTAAGIAVAKIGTATVSLKELQQATQSRNTRPDSSVKTREELQLLISNARQRNEKIVFTNGCFDLLHAGHVDYLQKAADLGDRLIVAINSDKSVTKLKGPTRPVNTLQGRSEVLAALRCVDWVIAFEDDTPARLIEQVKPDILVKGGDYKVEEIAGYDSVIANGGQVLTLPLKQNYSTTRIMSKITQDASQPIPK